MIKKLNNFLCLLLLCFSVKANNKIFVELDNVLFKVNESKFVPGILKGIANESYIDSCRNELFTYLQDCVLENTIDVIDTAVYYKNKEMPLLVKAYLLGVLDSDQVKEKALSIVKNKVGMFYFQKRFALNQAIEVLFTPEKSAEIMEPNENIIRFLKLCAKNKDNTLYLVTNKSDKTVNILKQKYPGVFRLFNGGCITSSSINSLKPSKSFFEAIVQQDSFDKCFAIESEEEHKKMLENIGIKSFLYNLNHDNNLLINKFKKLNLLN